MSVGEVHVNNAPMSNDSVITRRDSALRAASTPLVAAVLAADAAGRGSFRPQDVRFYFLLFMNWMGEDHRRPEVDLELTQVRRTLLTLATGGMAAGGAGRRPTWGLTAEGVTRLVEALCDPRAVRPFEHVLLVATVAQTYADIIAARVEGGHARRVRQHLDARRLLRAERRRLSDALDAMEARRDAGPALSARARESLAAGLDPVAAAAALEAGGMPYQLHPMRPYREVVAGLPAALARLELTEGHQRRARRLFAPLADDLRGRVAILAALEAELGA